MNFKDKDFVDIINKRKIILTGLINTLDSIKNDSLPKKHEITIEFNNRITEEKCTELFNGIETRKHSYLYTFEVTNKNYKFESLKRSLEKKKASNKENKDVETKVSYCKINNTESKSCIYVGGCRTNIINRIKQHIGFGHTHTYSLRLKHWCSPLRLKLTLYEFSKNVDTEAFQQIEDEIWEKLKPMFGKKGSK